MREILTALAAGCMGAVVGVLLAPGPAHDVERPATLSEPALKSALESTLGRRLDDLRQEVASLRSGLPLVRGAPSEISPATARVDDRPAPAAAAAHDAAAPAFRVESAGDGRFVREADEQPSPSPRPDRLTALHGWEKKTEVRGKWLFLGERAALGWFGTPRNISHDKDEDTERWYYDLPFPRDDDPDSTKTIRLDFRRGRLVEVSDYDDD